MNRFGPGPDETVIIAIAAMFYAMILLVVFTVAVIVWWKICKKAGYSGWLGLLMIIPIANLVLPLVIAFSEWPVLREIKALKQAQSPGPQI